MSERERFIAVSHGHQNNPIQHSQFLSPTEDLPHRIWEPRVHQIPEMIMKITLTNHTIER
jgi:hypothetical protein